MNLTDPSLAATDIIRRTCKKLRVNDAMRHNIGQQVSPMTHHRLPQLIFVYTSLLPSETPPEGLIVNHCTEYGALLHAHKDCKGLCQAITAWAGGGDCRG